MIFNNQAQLIILIILFVIEIKYLCGIINFHLPLASFTKKIILANKREIVRFNNALFDNQILYRLIDLIKKIEVIRDGVSILFSN